MDFTRFSASATKRAALGLAATACGLLFRVALARPHPVPPLPPPLAASPAAKLKCGCGVSPKGRRLHLIKKDAAGVPTIGPNNTYDVIIPDAVRWQAVHVEAGAEEWFGTNLPLPSGPDPTQGGWDAVYGRISRDGSHYQAPLSVPAGHLDIINYMPPSVGPANLPTIQFLIYVDAPALVAVAAMQEVAASASVDTPVSGGQGGAPRTTGATGAATDGTVTMDDGVDTDGGADDGCVDPVTVTAQDNLLEASSPQITPLPDSDLWPAAPSEAMPPLVKPNPAPREAGYPIPRWSSDTSFQVGIRKQNPATGKTRQKPVVTCKQKGPFNAPVPFPIDPLTKKPWDHYSCAPGGKWDEPSDGQPHWQCGPLLVGSWKTFGTITVNLSVNQTLDIQNIYNVQVQSGVNITMNVKYRDTRQSCERYVDHYKCGEDGKSWIYTGSDMYEKQGTGEIFLPAWLAYYEGYPPNGAPAFSAEYPRGPVRKSN